jgi:gliding motility-associated-like protein
MNKLYLTALLIFASFIMYAQAPSNDCAETPIIIDACGTNFTVTQAQMAKATNGENCISGGSCPINYTNGVGYDNLDCNTSTGFNTLGSDFNGSIENSLFWQFETDESCTYRVCVTATNCCCKDKGSTTAAQLHIYRISETLPVGNILEYYVTNGNFTGEVCYNINVVSGQPVLILIDGVNGTDCDIAVSVQQTANCSGCSVVSSCTITGPNSVCVGSTINLTGSGTPAASNPWVSSNTAAATVNSSGQVTGVAQGVTTITYTDSDGCSTTYNVTVNPLPVIGGATQVCAGQTANVTPNTGGTWSSSNPEFATVTNGGVVTGVSTGESTLTFTNTTTGCQSSVLFTINDPIVPTFTQLGPYCQNATPDALPTTSNNGVTGTWNAAISTASATTTTYTFTPTAGLCATQATMDVVIIAPTVPTFTQLGPYCQNSSAGTLPTTSTNGVTGTWNAAISTASATTTTYTFTPTAGLCATTATMDVTITPLDNASFSYSSSTHCLTGTNPLPTITGLSGGTFSGSAGLVVNSTTGEIDLASTGVGGPYTVTYTTNGPCPNFSTFQVSIVSSPSAEFTYGGPFCQNDPALTESPSFGVGASAGVFSATPPGLSINASTGVVTFATSTPGIYDVTNTIAASGGCAQAEHTTQITILPIPDASFTIPSSICLTGGTITLTPAQAGGTFSGTGVSGTTFDPQVAGIGGPYTITYNITVNGCSNQSTQQISVTSLDDASFDFDNYCFGTANGPTNIVTAGGTFSFDPAPGDGATINPSTGVITGGVAGATYSIVYSTSGDCAATSDPVDVTVLALPTATITGTRTALCAGEELPDLIISFTGEGPWTYNLNGVDATTSDNPLIFTSPANGGTFNVTTVTDANCTNTGNSSSTQIIVTTPIASFDADPTFGAAPLEVFFTNTSNGTSFSWEFGDGNTSTAANPTNTYTALGEYVVTLTITVNGCTATATDTITVIGGSKVEDLPNVFSPDGFGGNELFKAISENMSLERFQIFNRWGQLLHEGPSWDGTHNGQKVPEGTYYFIYYGEGADGKIYEGSEYTGHLTLVRGK